MNPDLIRRIVIGIIAVMGLTLIGWLVTVFVYNGGITITGGDPSLHVVITNTSGAIVAQGKDSQYRVSPGQYRVVATTSKSGIARVVQVNPLSNTTIKVGEVSLLHANVALHAPLYGVVPWEKWFVGYEPTTELIKRYDAAGNSSNQLTSPNNVGSEGDWDAEIPDRVSVYQSYKDQQAIAISNTRLYLVSPGGVGEINQEGITLKSAAFNTYVVGANSHQDAFVVGYNRDVYWYENSLAKAKKVYGNKKQFDQAAFGGDYAIVYSTALPNSREDLRGNYTDFQIDAQIVNVKNGQAYTVPGPITSATVSPDGKYATIKPRGQLPYLYNLAEKSRVADIDQPDGAAPFWISSTSYIYEKSKQVWRYNVESQASDEVAEVSGTITSFSNDSKGGYLATYYNSATDNGVFDISQTAAPAAVTPIQQFVPYTGNGFSIEYSNVNGPTITITTTAILNRADQLPQFRVETQAYRQAALDYLKSKGVDLTGVTILYDPADPLSPL